MDGNAVFVGSNLARRTTDRFPLAGGRTGKLGIFGDRQYRTGVNFDDPHPCITPIGMGGNFACAAGFERVYHGKFADVGIVAVGTEGGNEAQS